MIRRLLALALGGLVALPLAELTARVALSARHGTAHDRGGWSDVWVDPHPRYGWHPRPGARVRHVTTEFDVEVAIGAEGFRQSTRAAGSRRVVALGDSFVFGQGVAEEDRFTERLAARLPDTEVVNLGVPATGTDQQLLLWRDWAEAHGGADVVVLGYFPEAVARNAAGSRHGRAKPRFVLDADGRPTPALAASRDPGPGPRPRDRGLAIPGKLWLQRHSVLYGLLRKRFRDDLRRALGVEPADPYPEYAADAPAWRLTRALIELLRDEVAAEGGTLVVMIVPEPWHLRPDAGDAHQRAIADACAALDVPVLDLTARLTRDHYHAVDGHWNARGHAVAADALAEFLAARSR